MSNCRYCKWVAGMWRCTCTKGVGTSEFCNTEDISEEAAEEYCDYYEREDEEGGTDVLTALKGEAFCKKI